MRNDTISDRSWCGGALSDGRYELAFLSRYDRFKELAMIIAGKDQDIAEDLVHDTFLGFASTPRMIADFDNYMFISLRNAYRSHLRSKIRMRRFLSDASATDGGTWFAGSHDPRRINRTRDQLRAICQYACIRRATSIGASIVILRYIHGYSLDEVVRIVRRTQNAVECRLAMARREIGIFLAVPQKISYVMRKCSRGFIDKSVFEDGVHIQGELREIVFANRQGVCSAADKVRARYRGSAGELSKGDLAHLVACRRCLDITESELTVGERGLPGPPKLESRIAL